jgi:Mannosyltransferase (PIG-V)
MRLSGRLNASAARAPVSERPLLGVEGRSVLSIFVWSRAAIWIGALLAAAFVEPSWLDYPESQAAGDIFGVWARWDSYSFLSIAEHGYSGGDEPAFFPLYPAIVAALGWVLAAHYVVAGVLVSLACCLGAFLLLYRLAAPRLGPDGARRAVVYLAIFPMTLFLQAVYSESLYLLLTLAAFVLAERNRFFGAGVAAGLALLTRAAGVALLPALLLLAWRSPERRRALAGVAVAPALFATYPLLLWRETGDALAFVRAEESWHRSLSWAGPFEGIWDGVRAAWEGISVLWSALLFGADETIRPHATQVEYACFLILFLLLAVVVWRRFGAAYGVFALGSIALPLLLPAANKPLLSLPRFGLAIFPLFLALAVVGQRRAVHRSIVVISILLLTIHVVDWSLGQWVS